MALVVSITGSFFFLQFLSSSVNRVCICVRVCGSLGWEFIHHLAASRLPSHRDLIDTEDPVKSPGKVLRPCAHSRRRMEKSGAQIVVVIPGTHAQCLFQSVYVASSFLFFSTNT